MHKGLFSHPPQSLSYFLLEEIHLYSKLTELCHSYSRSSAWKIYEYTKANDSRDTNHLGYSIVTIVFSFQDRIRRKWSHTTWNDIREMSFQYLKKKLTNDKLH